MALSKNQPISETYNFGKMEKRNTKLVDRQIKYLKKFKIIFPIVHFLAAFIWERQIFDFTDNFHSLLSIPRNEYISDNFELIMTYILSKIFCLLIVLLLWKAFFFILGKQIVKTDFYILGFIYIVVLFVGIILYPELFGSIEWDNYTNYYMAIRFIPTYWQGVYTGALYAGCLMAIPHPIGIFIIQWSFFFSTVCYIYYNTKRLCPSGSFRFVPLVLFLIPESYFLTFNAYRNNFYTILLLFYISNLYFHIKSKADKAISIWGILFFSIITSFLMVWRSEGVLVGLGGIIIFLAFLIGISKDKIKKICFVLLVTFISYIGISSIQNIGSIKYYGKDYMIINTTPVLHNILNNPNSDLSYDTAQQDLNDIEKIVPVEVLKESGMSGYRDYNWTNGHLDFNQSLATDEDAKNYLDAYYSIILHNPTAYLDVQINFFFSAMQFGTSHTIYGFEDEKLVHLDSFEYEQWKIGRSELMATYGTQTWNDYLGRRVLSAFIKGIITIWREIVMNSGMNSLLHAVAIVFIFIIMIKELLNVIANKVYNNLAFTISFLLVLGEFLAVMLFMPDGRAAYLYPMLYASYLLLFLYILKIKMIREK